MPDPIKSSEVHKLHKLLCSVRFPSRGAPMGRDVFARAAELGFVEQVTTRTGPRWVATPAGEAWAAPFDDAEAPLGKNNLALFALEWVQKGISPWSSAPTVAPALIRSRLVTSDPGNRVFALTPRGLQYLADHGPYVAPKAPSGALPPTEWEHASSPPPRPEAPSPASPAPADEDAPRHLTARERLAAIIAARGLGEKAPEATPAPDDDREVVTPPGAFSWASQKSTERA